MKFYIGTINDNGSGMEYDTKEAFLHELSLMIDDCIENGGTCFDVSVNADANCFTKEEKIMTNEMQKNRWELIPNLNNEILMTWLDNLLESKNKMCIEELTVEEIKTEIEETQGSIDNFRAWGDKHAIIDCEEYIEFLTEILEEKKNG